MNRQELLYLVLGITALLEFAMAPLESHSFVFAEIAIYVAIATVLGRIVVFVLALHNFAYETTSANWANLIVIVATPVAAVVLPTIFGNGLNVHGVAAPALILDFAISVLCAFILFTRLIVRAF
jgi:hypothetical protein